jgi:hypothetical protein
MGLWLIQHNILYALHMLYYHKYDISRPHLMSVHPLGAEWLRYTLMRWHNAKAERVEANRAEPIPDVNHSIEPHAGPSTNGWRWGPSRRPDPVSAPRHPFSVDPRRALPFHPSAPQRKNYSKVSKWFRSSVRRVHDALIDGGGLRTSCVTTGVRGQTGTHTCARGRLGMTRNDVECVADAFLFPQMPKEAKPKVVHVLVTAHTS